MGHNSLYPASIRLDYQTKYGLHSQTIPTAKIALDGGVYKFVKEDLTVIGAVTTLIQAWVDVLKGFYPSTTSWLGWQAFTYATPTSPAIPFIAGALATSGTNASGNDTNSKATQATYTWRTDEFGIFKIILLDTIVLDFNKITDVANAGYVAPVHAIVAGANTWMRGRDGGKPQTFLQMSRDLNDKLRESYRMN